MKAICNAIVVLVFFSTTTGIKLCAQQAIILKDKFSQLPIENATYYLGKQKGKSAKNGAILFTVDSKNTLIITHISYETLKVRNDDITVAIQRGWIELIPSAAVYLNPVTVYALKGKAAQETIRLSNGDWVQHDAGQVLQQIPGFSAIRKSGVSGFDPVFRGFKLDQLPILQDGALTSTAACPNRMDPPSSQVLISQVQQIEVLKGPHSFRYGPSMGAVINFKSAPAEFSDTAKPFGRITTGYETNGEMYRIEGTAGIRTKNTQLTATGSYSKGHNYKDGNDSIIPARLNRGSVGLTADFKVKPNHILKLAATRNFARNTDFPTLMMDLVHDDTWMLQGQYQITGKNAWYAQWNTQVYASFVDHAMSNLMRPAYSSVQASTDAATNTKGGRTEFVILKNRSKVFFGADMKYETVDGNRIRKMITGPMAGKTIVDTLWQNSEITRGGWFGEWQYQLNQYKLVVSGRLDAVYAKANNTSAKFTEQYSDNRNTDINTSVSTGISRQWNNTWQAGLWLGRGVRSASLPERYINSLPIGMDPYEMLGNPRLKPEANNQADVVIGYKTNNTNVQWNGYVSLISNYIGSIINPAIVPRFGAPGVRQYQNIDEAILYGFEFTWQQQWLPVLQHQFTLAYTYGKNNETGKPLPEITPMEFRYRVEYMLLKNRIMPYLHVRHALEQNRIADDFGEKATSGFAVVDWGVKIKLINKAQATIAVNNLLNKAYHEHLSRYIRPTLALNAPGRSFVLMASYEF